MKGPIRFMSAVDYFRILQETGHSPNFCCSEEWFNKDGWTVYSDDEGYVHVMDDANVRMFPAILAPSSGRPSLTRRFPYSIGFSSFRPTPTEGEALQYWDHEFIYKPQIFSDLSGQHWRDVRKNLKWAREDLGEDTWLDSPGSILGEELDKLLQGWKPSDDAPVFAPETLVIYALEGKHRLALRGAKTGRLVALLIWDENWKYINFRYCLTIGGVRGLSDTARVAFHLYQSVRSTKLINDGGSLGRTGLFKYKTRLNPVAVNSIYGWTAKEGK